MDNEAHINNEIVVTNPIIEILKRTFGEKSLIKKNREKYNTC